MPSVNNLKHTLFIVLTCEQYIDTRVNAIRSSWARQADVIFLSDIPRSDTIIGFATPSTHAGIQEKYVRLFKRFDFRNYKYFFFCDDDTFINTGLYDSVQLPHTCFCFCRIGYLGIHGEDLEGHPTGYDFTTIRGTGTHRPLFYPGGGAGFIIDLEGVAKIQHILLGLPDADIPRSDHGDVTLGFWIRLAGLQLVHSSLLNYARPDNFAHAADDIRRNLSYHYVAPHLMANLHAICCHSSPASENDCLPAF